MVSSTEVLIGEDLIEGQCWTTGVLLITVGNAHVTREPAFAKQCSMSPGAMQDDDLDHLSVTECTSILS